MTDKERILSLIINRTAFQTMRIAYFQADRVYWEWVHSDTKIEKGDIYCKSNGEDIYLNKSYIIGNDEIQIGIYENLDFLIISFFHELGHIVYSKNGLYNSEIESWLNGFKLAKEYGYDFNINTYIWVMEQLLTYYKRDE